MSLATRKAAYARGLFAEWVAGNWLRLKGYRILARRYRTHVGEIDLVARRGGILVFAEVKHRARSGAAVVALTPRQRARIVRAAGLFLRRHRRLSGLRIRFDAVLIGPWRLPRHLTDAWREGEWTRPPHSSN